MNSTERQFDTILQLLRLRARLKDDLFHELFEGELSGALRNVLSNSPELKDLADRVSTAETRRPPSELLHVIDAALSRLTIDRSLDFSIIEQVASVAAERAVRHIAQDAAEQATRTFTSDSIERRTHGAIDQYIRSSPWFTVGRWLLLVAVVVVFGGTLFGVTQVTGLVSQGRQSQEAIEKARDDFLVTASQSRMDIVSAKVQAFEQAQRSLQKEVDLQSRQIDELGKTARAALADERDAQVRIINNAEGSAQDTLSKAAKGADQQFSQASLKIWTAKQNEELLAIGAHEKTVATQLDSMPTKIRVLENRVNNLRSMDANLAFIIAHRSTFDKPEVVINAASPGGDFQRFLAAIGIITGVAFLFSIASICLALVATRRIRQAVL